MLCEMKREIVKIMGIVNVTPDSFSDGGAFFDTAAAIAQGQQLVADGAHILDIGGESSRPGAMPVSAQDELDRVIPVIVGLKKSVSVPISIDTTKPIVAEAAIAAGATILNDITGLQNPEMIDVVARTAASVCIMHMQGTPQQMQENPQYDDVVQEVHDFLADRVRTAKEAGIQNIWIDPGIGFGKTLEHNLALLRHLDAFADIDAPLMLGTSRKSFIEKITGASVDERLPGTIASVLWAMMQGVSLVRVHDVAAVAQAIAVYAAIKDERV